MNNDISNTQFEEDVHKSFAIPEARPEFVNQVYKDLMQRAAAKTNKPRLILGMRPAWTVVLAVFTLLVISTIVIGPQKVYASVLKLLGYIPGVGIVDQSSPIRVLAEPVSITKDGISITVTSATLTGERTHLDYRIYGVPGSAYPLSEDVLGCSQQPYLRLPDGKQLTPEKDFPPIPESVNEAVLVLPCIFNTLPGTVPENWELKLTFVPAPPDLTLVPVIESVPTKTPSMAGNTLASEINPLVISKVLDIEDKFVLMGEFSYRADKDVSLPADSWWNLNQVSITGADGREVPQSYSNDFELPPPTNAENETWLYQLDKNFIPPVTITWSGQVISPEGSKEQAEFEFNAGLNPQNGREWTINKDFKLGGYNIRLVSIATGPEGYSFHFLADPGASANAISVNIAGYTPNCGGGGGGNDFPVEFDRSVCYANFNGSPEFPGGKVKIILNFQALTRKDKTFQVQWSPDTTQTGPFATSTPQMGVCLAADTLAQIKPVSADLASGTVLVYEQTDSANHWGLVLYNLNGSGKRVVVPNGNWGSLSPDGSKVAYSALDNGIHVVDLATLADKALPNSTGYDPNWSPDGKQIAYIGSGDSAISSLFVVNADGTQVRHVSNWTYEAVVGWSADSSQLYFAAPFTGGVAWKINSIDLASGTVQEHFTIENGTPKFLNAKLSLDGKWIAYRGRDNSSLYLVHPDGSDMHLVLDNAGVDGVEWSSSGWLVASLRKTNSDESIVVLINPESCTSYLLSGLKGEVEGVFIP